MRVSLKTTDSGEGDGDGEDEKTPGELGCINFVASGWKLQLPVESDTKPENTAKCVSRKDIYNDWFDSEEKAKEFIKEALA